MHPRSLVIYLPTKLEFSCCCKFPPARRQEGLAGGEPGAFGKDVWPLTFTSVQRGSRVGGWARSEMVTYWCHKFKLKRGMLLILMLNKLTLAAKLRTPANPTTENGTTRETVVCQGRNVRSYQPGEKTGMENGKFPLKLVTSHSVGDDVSLIGTWNRSQFNVIRKKIYW